MSITAKPTVLNNATTANFSFTGVDTGGGGIASFLCSIDGSVFGACSSPSTYSSLVQGSHSFAVKAVDTAGNVSNVQTYNWTLDTTAPTLSITSKPAALVDSGPASFSFSATDSGGGTVSGYQCKVDSGAYASCTSPKVVTGLLEGNHTFYVVASDSVGNVSAEESYTWAVDTTAPAVTISSSPSSITNATTASFSFSATDSGGGSVASYLCKIDAGSFAACTSPQGYSSLVQGTHVFSVKATDSVGNVGTIATYSWNVDTTAPTVSITSKPVSLTNSSTANFVFSGSDTGGGNIAGFECALDAGAYSSCTSPLVYTSLTADNHTFSVRPVDTAGNVGSSATYAWTIDMTTPMASINSGPNSITNSTGASFSFSATPPPGGSITGYECSLDGAAWGSCASPKSYAGLAQGSHTFQVRSIDDNNNASSSSSQTWVVDLTNPAVTITSQPSSVVGTTSASFVFNATDAGGGAVASFQCKLDAGSYASCSSPMSYSSLIAGSHTFSVIVFDTAGNQSSAQAVSWTVDLVGPSTTMSMSPNAVTNSTSASLTFNATDSGGGTVGGYYCKIDSGSFVSCTSPQSYSSLSVGSHVFQVYAVDSVGNIGSTVSSSWMIDTTAPTINISSTPSSMTNATTASFSFSATDTGGGSVASYQCKLDAGSYQSCISPQSYSSLGAGNHTFSVTATDTAGNTSTAATYSWSLDLTSPTVTITANPTSLNNATSGSFSFSATDSGGGSIASYQCKLDSNLYSACSSPSNVSGLSQGAHTYYVTATDTAGNNSVAATYTWTTDLTAPTLSLTANPALLTNATTASFSFSAVDTGGGSVANFKCSLDGGAAATCTSPASYSSLAAGGHNFAIYTTDTAGNISATTTYSWTVDLTAPTLSITSKPNAVTNATTASFAFNATDSGGGSIASYQCKVDAGSYTTCTSPQAYSSLAAGSHTFSVTATDTAGNTSAASTYSWTIDLTAPTLTITTPSTNGTVVTLASLTSYVLGGACSENGVSVSLTGSLTATASCLSGSWSTSVDLSGLSDGTLSVTASQTDVAGNTGSSTARTFVKDTVAPTISITTPVAFKGGSSTGAVSWAMTEPYASATNFTVEIFNGSVWSTVGSKVATAGANSNQAYSLSGFAVPAVEVNNAKLRISVSDAAGNSKTQESGVFPIDSTPPVLSSIIINDGDQYAGTTLVSVKVNLTDNNFSGTNLKVRLAQANAGTTDCQSEYADNNWQTWTSSSTNIPFTIVPTDGIKKICVWGKDLVGNVSVISPSTGTSDVTYDTIEFSTGNIPVISGFSVTNGSGGYIALKDDPLTITWSSTDTEGLDNNPVTISYTTDNTVWKDIFTNQDISIPANKTWFGGLSGHPTSGSGTVTTFNAPSSNYFKVKIQAKDLAGNTSSIVSSQTFNTGNWSVYTGVTDRGDGGTGKGAALYGSTQASPFTINPKTGDIYAVDGKLGIRKLDAKTGIVSTIIKYGGTNLPDNGFLNASSAINIGTYTALFFDSNGLLYLSVNMTGYEVIIYQINLDTNAVLKYAGGGTSYDGGVAATSLRLSGSSAFSFDEQNSLYLAVYCNGVSISNDTDLIAAPIRLIKIAQNSNGTPGTTTRILGDCTTSSTITNGADAYSAPMINDYSTLYGILPFNNGNTILLLPYSKKTKTYKIINGKTYTASINTFPTAGMTYNPDDGYVYKLTSAGIEKVLINTAGADGDTATTIFSSNSSAIGCSADGTLNTNYCGSLLTTPVVRQGILYFADGGGVNAYGDYSIRYFDSSGKLQTIFGGKPFNGHDLDRSLVRGSFAGIYYKKASEPNQTAFPAGLYFMDRYGMVFGYIDPNTNITKNLWGNQSTRVASWAEGTVISKDLNMSNPYAGGEGWPLTFDNTGLPWLRVAGNAIKIDADNKIVKKTKSLTTPMLQLAPNGANPVNYGLNYYSGTHNFALKNDGLFAMPNFVNVPAGSDPIISIRYMDFSLLTTPIILGGIFKSSDVMAASPDISTAGQVAAAPLWTNCRGVGICFMQYDSPNDRLYFSEGTKMRYISKPDNTSAATLGTLFTAVSQIANFALTPDGSQMWYFRTNGGLYCHKITSTKTWCDDTTDHFSIRATAGFTFSPGADQITFKDNQTMFLSTYSGQILQFTLPTTP
ncbi:MAG: beta strand repeat-containing protein [Bdellovibrio sp.]